MTKPGKLKYTDRNHAYYLNGTRAKSITTVAKLLEDNYALEKWGKRMVAIGMAASPNLIDAVAAHFDDKDKLNELVADAEAQAKAHHAAVRGTAIHRVTERHDRGEPVMLTDLLRQSIDAWRRALDSAGYEVVSEYVERCVVYPEQMICGTLDRIVRRKSDGLLRVLDLKSGERAIKYPHPIAIQIGLYANAPWIAGTWEGESGETSEFEPMPEGLDREVGLVLHMPEPTRVAIVEVDIAAGWDIARRAIFPALEWRNRTDLVTVTELAVDDDPFFAEQSAPAPAADLESAPAIPSIDTLTAAATALRDDHGHMAMLLLAADWPGGLPTIKQARNSGGYTDVQARIVAAHIAGVRERFTPFPDVPLEPPVIPDATPAVEPVPPASREAHDDLIKRLQALPADMLAFATAKAKEAGCPNLRTYRATNDALTQLSLAVAVLEAELSGRRRVAGELLGTVDAGSQMTVLQQAGVADVQCPTEDDLERLAAACARFNEEAA